MICYTCSVHILTGITIYRQIFSRRWCILKSFIKYKIKPKRWPTHCSYLCCISKLKKEHHSQDTDFAKIPSFYTYWISFSFKYLCDIAQNEFLTGQRIFCRSSSSFYKARNKLIGSQGKYRQQKIIIVILQQEHRADQRYNL